LTIFYVLIPYFLAGRHEWVKIRTFDIMSYCIQVKEHTLRFWHPATTSRGTLKEKTSWFLILKDTKNQDLVGLGECNLIPGLSVESKEMIDSTLQLIAGKTYSSEEILQMLEELKIKPTVRFGLETAFRDLLENGKKILFRSSFTEGMTCIPINGLIWMGPPRDMYEQLRQKLHEGWTCIKLKIGAVHFEEELSLLRYIRSQFTSHEVSIRVDANGAFDIATAAEKLKRLSELEIHSIEQPIQPGHPKQMAELCNQKILPIALDEELIGVHTPIAQIKLLEEIKPQYLVLKPGLIGGIDMAQNWIKLAIERNIDYWITSALESNLGLNAIAQWTATLLPDIPQGLGTGQLYQNNIESPLTIKPGELWYNPSIKWGKIE